MPAANIKINGIAASDDDWDINDLVLLDNQNVGGETTFLWTIVDQPPGPVDVLSSTVIQNPTFTPKKEGTYLLNLLVNGTLTDQKLVGIRQLKSRNRVPAARETIEDDAVRGWASDFGSLVQEHDGRLRDPGLIVGVNLQVGAARGHVMYANSVVTIKIGLPGQEVLPTFLDAHANVAAEVDSPLLGVLEGGVDGNPNPAVNAIVLVRVFGRFSSSVGAPVVGQNIYVSDGSLLAIAAGTRKRVLGTALALTGPNFDTWINSFIPGVPEFQSVSLASATIFALLLTGNAGFSAAIDQILFKTGGGRLRIGTITADDINFFTGNLSCWDISGVTGELAANLANYPAGLRILNLAAPVAAGDATRKSYVDAVSSLGTQAFGNTTTPAIAGTSFLDPYFAARVSQVTEATMRVTRTGVIRNLFIQARVGPVAARTYTVRVNAANTLLVATLAAAGTQASNIVNTIAVVAGDRLSISELSGAATAGPIDIVTTMEFDAS